MMLKLAPYIPLGMTAVGKSVGCNHVACQLKFLINYFYFSYNSLCLMALKLLDVVSVNSALQWHTSTDGVSCWIDVHLLLW